ncbi:MAG: FecR domain-containing protein [Mariniblastus sp.]
MDNEELKRPFGKLIDDQRVRELVDAYSACTATDAEIAELSQLIESSRDVCDYFIAHTTLLGQLVVYSNAGAHAYTIEEDSSENKILGFPRIPASWPMVRAAAASLMFLAIMISSILFWNVDLTPNNTEIAEVVGQMLSESGKRSAGPLLAGQTISIETGECKISLVNGVELVISSPAKFAMESAMRCRLWEGRLTADVPQQAIGFRVLTKHADIVDQGTRFGVAVQPDSGTDIAVFEGLVDVASHNQSLPVGRAVSINADGILSRLQLVTPATFESSGDNENASQSVITSVKDNIRSLEELGYYRVVPGGFSEDKPAYVDRVHQWNGVGVSGLPSELLGGDYVMPFNDDKLKEDFEITVTLSQTAVLYVLFDDRNATPDWLAKDFVDTGANVGQDEGHVPGNKTIMETAVGSGNSIDNEFSVWKSRTPLSGEVTLQGLWNEAVQQRQEDDDAAQNKRSMYGVVAVPVQ